ncbi:fimbria/pilus outer membrane usher protein [Serratia fonticola]|uniref:fimbria/pilus outer membrane usher protein n=1 Tax=Serratia fonticola TaxID=47917 RepID=UPI001644C6BB|nr:fimbria/pilus outer membrane usher protein [Serratia fonticola]MBC3219665.1 fimbrial biogenesis outer membrane usher protein [Serratia fonticola]
MRIHPLAAVLSPLLFGGLFTVATPLARGQDYFDPALLSLDGQAVVTDLSAFETAGKTPAGTYLVTLLVNQQDLGQFNIVFADDAGGKAMPELTPAMLAEAGVNVTALPAFSGLPADKPVNDLKALIPEAQVRFDFSQQRLELSIPQIAMKPHARGTVDPTQWDDGVPALLLNYSLNVGHSRQNGRQGQADSDQTNLFGNFRSGLNWQSWRLRSDMSYTRSENNSGDSGNQRYEKIQFSSTYLQRDIRAWRADILVGESFTGNDVFDGIPFRGAKLSSSEEMLPVSLRGFAPVVTGIAQSNARVSISQNGNVVYQTYVAPGPFRIDDLYQTGQGGDLTVTITEADGSVRTSTQTFSALPVMQRPGGLKYELTAGRYNGGVTVGSREAEFALGTLMYGLPHNVTLYGGGLVAKDYLSAVGGSGVSLGAFGAFSADITLSSATQHDGQNRSGQSYRMRYAKSLLDTGTSVDLTAYRYSTRHYLSFTDFNTMGYRLSEGQVPWAQVRKRSEFQVRVSQQLGAYGSLYLAGSREDYWGQEDTNTTLSAGYNASLRGVSYGLAYSIDRINASGEWPQNRQLSLNVQVPFSLFSPAAAVSRSYASYQLTHNSQGGVQQQAGISGTALDDRLSYSAMEGWGSGNNGAATSTLNTSWQGSKGMASAGYSYSRDVNAVNLSGNGGVVIHSGGITLSQQLGTSVALVSAPDAGGVEVMNGNVRTDSRGYAVVPYLSPYQNNAVTLNPATLPDNVDLTQNSVNVSPTKGAVVMTTFATRVGYQALITLTRAGQPVPFGTQVTLEDSGDNNHSGIMGDAGQVWLSGLPEKGRLRAVWGPGSDQQCRATFNLARAAASENNPVRSLKVNCEQ